MRFANLWAASMIGVTTLVSAPGIADPPDALALEQAFTIPPAMMAEADLPSSHLVVDRVGWSVWLRLISGLRPDAQSDATAAVARFVPIAREYRRLAGEYFYPPNRSRGPQLWEAQHNFGGHEYALAFQRRNRVFGLRGPDIQRIEPPEGIKNRISRVVARFAQRAETRAELYRALIFAELLLSRAYLLSPADAKAVADYLGRIEWELGDLWFSQNPPRKYKTTVLWEVNSLLEQIEGVIRPYAFANADVFGASCPRYLSGKL